MLKYIIASGLALSALYLASEIGVNVFGNMLKTKRETGLPVKTQLMTALKNRQE